MNPECARAAFVESLTSDPAVRGELLTAGGFRADLCSCARVCDALSPFQRSPSQNHAE
jgi:hypothetical protein